MALVDLGLPDTRQSRHTVQMSCEGNGTLMGTPLKDQLHPNWLAQPRSGQRRIGAGSRCRSADGEAKTRGFNECKISANNDHVPLGTPSRKPLKVFGALDVHTVPSQATLGRSGAPVNHHRKSETDRQALSETNPSGTHNFTWISSREAVEATTGLVGCPGEIIRAAETPYPKMLVVGSACLTAK